MKSTDHHSEREHLRCELIRRLESQAHIFAQTPSLITAAVKQDAGSSYDKLFIRADKIDSNGALIAAIDSTRFYIRASQQLVCALYFALGFFGVTVLLGTQTLNFFYLLIALLGWHTLTLLLWMIGLMTQRLSIMGTVFDKIILQFPMIKRLIGQAIGQDSSVQTTALTLIGDTLTPVKRWYLARVIHATWLCSLAGAIVGLFGLFLFKSYAFAFESTLLTQAHFAQLLHIFGYIPEKLGFTLPQTTENAAQFAWLVMICLVLYGIVPRLAAFLYCHYRARSRFAIDVRESYYDQLIKYFNQTIIDRDDYQAPTATKATAKLSDRLIFASLERDLSAIADSQPYFGIVDSRDEIAALVKSANEQQAQICLIISTATPPDRGILRKIDAIAAADFGLIAQLHGDAHLAAWVAALDERQIAVI